MDRMIEKFKVNECWGFDLQTGALIMLWLSLFASIPGTILIIFPLLGIYGIYSGNENFLKIHVIYSIIGAGLLIISEIIWFICMTVLEIQGKLGCKGAMLWAYLVILAIVTGIHIYFVRVYASLYLKMKHENAGIQIIRSTNNQQDEMLVRSAQQPQYSTFP